MRPIVHRSIDNLTDALLNADLCRRRRAQRRVERMVSGRDTTNSGDAIVSAPAGPLRDRPIRVACRRLSTSADNCAAGPGTRSIGLSRRRRRHRRNRARHLESAASPSPPALVDAEKKPVGYGGDTGPWRRARRGAAWVPVIPGQSTERTKGMDDRPTDRAAGRTKSVRFYRSRSRPRCAGSRENLPSCDVRDFYPPVLSVSAK